MEARSEAEGSEEVLEVEVVDLAGALEASGEGDRVGAALGENGEGRVL